MLKILLWLVYFTKGESKSAFLICLVDKKIQNVSSLRKLIYGVSFFIQLTRGRKRGNGLKLDQDTSRLDIWKKVFHQKSSQALEQTAQKSA